MSDGSLHVGMGSVSYVPGKGVGVGIFTVGSRGIPQVSLESAAIMAGITVIGGIVHGKRASTILSETTPMVLPVNTAREFISFLRFALGKSGGPSKPYSRSEIKKAEAFLKSAENQGMVYSALIHIDEMIASVNDPYLAALLMERRDYFITRTNRFMPIGSRFDEKLKGPSGTIAARIEKSVERSEAFTQKYAAWLEGEISHPPSNDEIRTYMMDALYLSQKLAMTVKKEIKDRKTRFKVMQSSPFSMESTEIMARYLKAVGLAYQVFENPRSGLMSHITKTVVDANTRFIFQLKDPKIPTETALESKEKIDSAFAWLTHMQRMAHFYPMRQKYCLWRTSKEENGQKRFGQLASIAAVSTPSEETILLNLRRFVSSPAITKAITHNSIIAAAVDTLAGIEELRTQQPFEDIVDLVVHAKDVVVRGFDFTSVIDEHRSLRTESTQIFNLLKRYRAQRATGWPNTDRESDDYELFHTIFQRAKNSFLEAAKKRPEEFSHEISRMSETLQYEKEELGWIAGGAYSDMKKMMAEVSEPISDVDSLMQPALNNFSQLKTIISSVRTHGWTSLSHIVDMDTEDTRRMSIIMQSANAALMASKEVVVGVRLQLENLRNETARGDEKKKLECTLDRLSTFEKKLEVVSKEMSRLDAAMRDFFFHRAGAALMLGWRYDDRRKNSRASRGQQDYEDQGSPAPFAS